MKTQNDIAKEILKKSQEYKTKLTPDEIRLIKQKEDIWHLVPSLMLLVPILSIMVSSVATIFFIPHPYLFSFLWLLSIMYSVKQNKAAKLQREWFLTQTQGKGEGWYSDHVNTLHLPLLVAAYKAGVNLYSIEDYEL